jgi:hypothetical protein
LLIGGLPNKLQNCKPLNRESSGPDVNFLVGHLEFKAFSALSTEVLLKIGMLQYFCIAVTFFNPLLDTLTQQFDIIFSCGPPWQPGRCMARRLQ